MPLKAKQLGVAAINALTRADARIDFLYLWLIGDSNGIGSGAPFVGGWRTGLEQALRKVRSDFDFVGHVATIAASSSATGLAWHSCVSGDKIADATSAMVARLALCVPAPAGAVVVLGTNDIVGGRTALQMETDWTAYKAAFFTALPGAHLFVVAPPVFVAGASVGGNLSAWSAVRTAYVAWLANDCAGDSRITYVDPCAGAKPAVGPGDFQEGVHLNKMGNAAYPQPVANAIDLWMSTAGRVGGVIPNVFKQRNKAGSILLPTVNDRFQIVTGINGLDMPAASFAFAVDVYPLVLDAAAPHALASLGPRHNEPNSWFVLAQQGAGISYQEYDGSGVGVVSGFACDAALVANAWHRGLVIMYRGATGQSVAGLYVNAKLVGMLSGLASTWLASAETFRAGTGIDYTACPGYYSALRAWGGANVPRPGSMAALLAAEANYYQDASIAQGAGRANYEFDGALTDDVSGNNAATLVGAAVQVTAANTPLRPWETGAEYSQITRTITGQFTLTGVTQVDVAGAFPIGATISWSLATVGATPGVVAPYFSAAQIAGHFYVKSGTALANDVYNWRATW